MTDRPILFSGPMVRAILDGRKTQTRRVLKPQPESMVRDGVVHWWCGFPGWSPMMDEIAAPLLKQHKIGYAFGDRLWVRETWAQVGTMDPPFDVYRATYPNCLPSGLENVPEDIRDAGYKWTPAIHMPRGASRLTLLVTDVRIQRLQDISEADAEAEGADPVLVPPDGGSCPHVEGFRDLWDSLAKPGTRWADNPWIVAISFEPHRCNIDAMPALEAAQ